MIYSEEIDVLVYVRMVDSREEANFGRFHGIRRGQEEFELEDSSFVRTTFRSYDNYIEVPQVVLMRLGADARS